MFSVSLLNQFAFAISLFTTTGIALHDMKLDRAFITTVETPVLARAEAAPTNLLKTIDLHTHIENGSYAQAIHDLQNGVPRINPRDDIKKHITPKSVTRGHYAFDNYNLPMV